MAVLEPAKSCAVVGVHRDFQSPEIVLSSLRAKSLVRTQLRITSSTESTRLEATCREKHIIYCMRRVQL
jgi:hypothetical protein